MANKKIKDIKSLMTLVNSKVTEIRNIEMTVEVYENKRYGSVHLISIKDPSANMKAVIYRKNYKEELVPGDKIEIEGSMSIFNTNLQLVINSYKKMGDGDLNKLYEKLKKELEKKGFFKNKREISNNYKRIGIVSSLTAAGFKDAISIFNKRCAGIELIIYPSLVQGESAAKQISEAIKLANKHKYVEVIAVLRGGGDKEDLKCFNDKELAYTIFDSTIPIVTGIGHQINETIADLVADKNYITPSAVAQNITQDKNYYVEKLIRCKENLKLHLMNKIHKTHDYIYTSKKIVDRSILDLFNKYRNDLVNHKIQLALKLDMRMKDDRNMIKDIDNKLSKYQNIQVIIDEKVITTKEQYERAIKKSNTVKIVFIDGSVKFNV